MTIPTNKSIEAALISQGQRHINIIWEVTQAAIALCVTVAVLYTSVITSLRSDMNTTAFLFLSNIAFTIIGFYFGRTNHQRIGGVGPDSNQIIGR